MEDGAHLHELLEALESGILSLERDRGGDPAVAIQRLFQSAHNLKSGLAMAGLHRASKRFHGLEDGLDDMRRGRQVWTSGWADAILETVDMVRTCLDEGHDDDLDPDFAKPSGDPSKALSPPVLSPQEAAGAARAAAIGEGVFRIEKLFLPGLTQEEYEGHLIYEDIRDSGTLLSVTPDWAGYSKATGEVVVRFLFCSPQSADQLANLFFDPLISVTLPAASASPAPRYRILVVDDDAITAQVLKKSLEAYGEVTLASDGGEGATIFDLASHPGKRFDVVILDMEMPEVDGHGALLAIRTSEERQGIHGLDRCLIFMNTSNPDLEKVRTSFRLQADRYFIKPMSVEKIKKKLEESLPWLESRRRGAP